MKACDILQSFIDEPSNDVRLEFVRSLVFRLYIDCIAGRRPPTEILVDVTLQSGSSTAISLTPFVSQIETLGGLVKTLFSAKIGKNLDVVPCRVEDIVGSGFGLMLLAQDQPVVLIGPLELDNGLFLRQIDARRGNVLRPKTIAGKPAFPQVSVSLLPSGLDTFRKRD